MSDRLVIIPTYNEKENVANIIKAVFSLDLPFHVLIIDDGSPDGTAEIVKQMMVEYKDKLHLEERTGKLGLGTAYIHGFKWALARNYNYIFEMDADFSHNPKDLIRLYNACSEKDTGMSVGSRYTSGGKLENWPLSRIFISFGASLYTRMITWMPVKDPTAGFVCYSREVLETIDFDKITFVGYAFQIQMKFATWMLGFQIVEVPITFTDRVEGTSKMSGNIVKEAVFGVLKMKLQSFSKSYKKA